MAERCLGTNRDGTPCSAAPRARGYCLWHDAALASERETWRAKGGANKSNKSRAKKQLALTSDDLLATLSRAITKVEAGELEPGPANAMASLARAMNSIRETTEIERRLGELEARALTSNDRRFA
jgi:hypothetical protein